MIPPPLPQVFVRSVAVTRADLWSLLSAIAIVIVIDKVCLLKTNKQERGNRAKIFPSSDRGINSVQDFQIPCHLLDLVTYSKQLYSDIQEAFQINRKDTATISSCACACAFPFACSCATTPTIECKLPALWFRTARVLSSCFSAHSFVRSF